MHIAITLDIARKLITEQFPEYPNLQITDVEKKGMITAPIDWDQIC